MRWIAVLVLMSAPCFGQYQPTIGVYQPTERPPLRPVVMIYTGEKVHGKGWCNRCNQMKPLFKSTKAMTIHWSEEAVTDSIQIYPAIRFADESGTMRYTAEKGSDKYYVPATLEELEAKVLRNMKPKD